MKRLLFLLIFAILMLSNVCFANQYDDQPERYLKIDTGKETVTYLDMTSIKSIKYAPPVYMIQCQNIAFDEADDITVNSTIVYTYNYDAKTIQVQVPKSSGHTGDGSVISTSIQSAPPIDIKPKSLGYMEATVLFKQLYGEKYANEFKNRSEEKPAETSVDVEQLPPGSMI